MILSAAEKKNRAIQKRRKIAIIAIAVLVAVLSVALVFILDYVRTSTFKDPADGVEYFVRYREKAYALYDTDKKTKLPTDAQYGYYVTHAGTLVNVDAATGEIKNTIYVDTGSLVGDEAFDDTQSLMMFRHVEKKDIRSVLVVNDNGKHSYEFARFNRNTFKRDDQSEFAIIGSPLTDFDLELFSALHVAAGYSITSSKIVDPIKDANGAFSEYGLVPERRVDDEGKEYDYVPTYYVLTEKSGTQHKVIIGDRLVTGTGYYAQYVKMVGTTEQPADAVYVLGTHIADSILLPIEEYVVPELTYPMSVNTAFDVEFFRLHRKAGKLGVYDERVAFSYIDMSERENTASQYIAYRFEEGTSPSSSLEGYVPSTDNISNCLNALCDPTFVGIHTFMLTDESLLETGLYAPSKNADGTPKLDAEGNPEYEMAADYMITFFYSPRDDEGNKQTPVQNVIMISGPNEDGNYYALTHIYMKNAKGEYEYAYDHNMIVEVDGRTMDFLEWDSYDWIDSSYINTDIVFCESIQLQTKDYSASFTLDNSLSDQSEGKSSKLLSITGHDSQGHAMTTFAQKIIPAKYNCTWVITETSIKIYKSDLLARGVLEEVEYTSVHYEKTCLDAQVQVDTVGIEALNGDTVYVYADYIETHKANGAVEREVRYGTSLFRALYRTFSYASIIDSYPLTDWSEEEKNALLSDENCLMTLTFTSVEGDQREEFVYRFYKLPAARKVFLTLNGNGEFYVHRQRMDKFVSDCQRFFNLQPIDDTGKT